MGHRACSYQVFSNQISLEVRAINSIIAHLFSKMKLITCNIIVLDECDIVLADTRQGKGLQS